MGEQEIIELLKKYRQGTLNPEETARLETWYIDTASKSENVLNDAELKESMHFIGSKLPLKYAKPKTSWGSIQLRKAGTWAIAASIAIVVGTGLYFYTDNVLSVPQTYANDIAPGKNSATLTLANGQRIRLSAIGNGELAKEPGVSITKTADGKLVYRITGDDKAGIGYNILTTNNGEKAQLLLPDGTSVWLNAASSIRFPTNFAGLKYRAVQLSGEAYFEVFKNKSLPFLVKTDKQDIQVLGTHFNVNNYMEEAIAKTTLLEGSVMINNSTELAPGQQAAVMGTSVYVSNVDTELAVAWKNNKFMFESEKIEDIMKMVERWYNVEVVYEGEIPDDQFGGSVSRFDKVSKVLSMLELTGNVHFKIEGRRITVMK